MSTPCTLCVGQYLHLFCTFIVNQVNMPFQIVLSVECFITHTAYEFRTRFCVHCCNMPFKFLLSFENTCTLWTIKFFSVVVYPSENQLRLINIVYFLHMSFQTVFTRELQITKLTFVFVFFTMTPFFVFFQSTFEFKLRITLTTLEFTLPFVRNFRIHT